MLMAEVIVNVTISIPYSINLVYGAATFYVTKSAQQLEVEGFITFITQFLVYFTGVVPFYLFILTSKPFRRGFIHILLKLCKKCAGRQTRIVPSNTQKNVPTNSIRIINR
jgi:hypothetical protein